MKIGKSGGKYADAFEALDGTFLEMKFTDAKRSNNNSHIIATKVDKNPKSINNDEYEWMSY